MSGEVLNYTCGIYLLSIPVLRPKSYWINIRFPSIFKPRSMVIIGGLPRHKFTATLTLKISSTYKFAQIVIQRERGRSLLLIHRISPTHNTYGEPERLQNYICLSFFAIAVHAQSAIFNWHRGR